VVFRNKFSFFNLLVYAKSFLRAFESLCRSLKFGPSQSTTKPPIDTLVLPRDDIDELVEASLS
jgi:hypothetical protein